MHKASPAPGYPACLRTLAAATTVPATAAETSPDNPWPLQLLSQKLKMHIDRAPSAWVEGQVIEMNRRGTNAYLTLRDIDAEISLPASVWTKVLDRQEIPLERRFPGGGPDQGRVLAEDRPAEHVREGHPAGGPRATCWPGSNGCAMPWPRKGCSSDARKKRLPLLPHRIGLITGRDSDAKKDVAPQRGPALARRRIRDPRGGRPGQHRRRAGHRGPARAGRAIRTWT